MLRRDYPILLLFIRLYHFFEWPLLMLMLAYAYHLKDPYLLVFRQWATPVLLLLCIFLIVQYGRKRRGMARAVAILLLTATSLLTLQGEFLFRYYKRQVLNDVSPEIQRIGQSFVIGYRDFSELKRLASQGLIGGVFVTRANAAHKSAEALRAEIAELQVLRAVANLPPLVVTADQEGGIVSRLSPPLSFQPSLGDIVSQSNKHAERLQQAETLGRMQGAEMASIGVTVNLSPVVDLKTGQARDLINLHTQIDKRAISADPKLTAEMASAYARGMESQGVRATLKHFPGLGRIREDTHHFAARLDTPVKELEETDWKPFREAAKVGSSLIMLGHVALSELDDEYPVSFSRTVIQKVLRGGWEFQGLLITDDLAMRASYQHGLCNVAVKAINAGVDYLLVSYDTEQLYEMLYCAKQAYEKGLLDTEMLKESIARRERSL